ncbi:hypothetical protein [Stenotrophomonas maltophilia]|uniref:hypothetical protein n=1 Tax=Stenotrophomonas maltophilia TaxID=40324 RepID=UPI003BA1A2BC
MNHINMCTCTWLAAAVIAALPGIGKASGVSPEELATLAMRLILQQDDDSIVRFHSLVTGSTEEEVRDEYLSEYRDGLDGVMAAAVEGAQGGRVLYKVMTEAQHRVQCAPVLPSPPVELDADGTELAVVRMRCMIPEIRHIEAGEPADAGQGDLIPETNRSWKTYLEDLRQPATVPIHFTWTLQRDPSGDIPGWTPSPYVFEANMMMAALALSPQSLPGGTANHINSMADAAAEDDDVDPQDAEDAENADDARLAAEGASGVHAQEPTSVDGALILESARAELESPLQGQRPAAQQR